MTKQAGIYARISLDRAKTELGVQRQEEDCRALASSLGFEVAEVYVDNDTSASKREVARPAYDRMWTDLREGRIDVVLAYHPDRLYRRLRFLEDVVDTVEPIAKAGRKIEVHTVAGEIDLATASGRFTARLFAALAQYESERTGERIARKRAEMTQRGIWGGGFRPWGYQVERTPDGALKNARLVVDAAEAKVIREVVQKVKAGESLRSVTRWLADSGEMTTEGNRWNQTHLRKYLLRGAPGIISAKDLRAVTAILTDPARTPTAKRGRYLLTGLLVCGKCEGNLTGRPRYKRGAPGEKWQAVGRTYVCNRGFEGVHLTIEAELLEEAIVAAARNRYVVEEIAPVEDPAAPLVAERDRIESDMEALGDSDLPDAVIRGRARKLERELHRIEEELAAATPAQSSWSTLYAETIADTRTDEEYLADPSTRAWLETLLTGIKIAPAKAGPWDPSRISVRWRPGVVEMPGP